MELDISRFFKEASPRDYSASMLELGENAGRITWRHALEDAPEFTILDNPEKLEAFREFVRDSGGWDGEECEAFTPTELNALCIQWVSGDLREAGLTADSGPDEWAEYEKASEAGNVAGRIFKADDGRVYFYCGC